MTLDQFINGANWEDIDEADSCAEDGSDCDSREENEYSIEDKEQLFKQILSAIE